VNISPSITSGVEYYWKRTSSWKWIDGSERWWEVFVRFADGMNGAGGLCCEEMWRWNGSSQTMRSDWQNLGAAESVALVRELEIQLSKGAA
jgi:hypothetical protein